MRHLPARLRRALYHPWTFWIVVVAVASITALGVQRRLDATAAPTEVVAPPEAALESRAAPLPGERGLWLPVVVGEWSDVRSVDVIVIDTAVPPAPPRLAAANAAVLAHADGSLLVSLAKPASLAVSAALADGRVILAVAGA